MKRSILTAIVIMVCAFGLMAQSKKADTAAKAKHLEEVQYRPLTHNDSLDFFNAIHVNDPNSNRLDILPFNSSRLPGIGFNDVIDVEHEIK